jgi:hypothetical protein
MAPHQRKRYKRFLGFLACLTLAFVAAWGIFLQIRRNKFSAGFEKVNVGDTKQVVVQLFGSPPEETISCHDPHDILKNCAEIYCYYSFLERWEVYFDTEGRVIVKGHNVSF